MGKNLDMLFYLIGYGAGNSAGKREIVIEDAGITCADDGEGNITITINGGD